MSKTKIRRLKEKKEFKGKFELSLDLSEESVICLKKELGNMGGGFDFVRELIIELENDN